MKQLSLRYHPGQKRLGNRTDFALPQFSSRVGRQIHRLLLDLIEVAVERQRRGSDLALVIGVQIAEFPPRMGGESGALRFGSPQCLDKPTVTMPAATFCTNAPPPHTSLDNAPNPQLLLLRLRCVCQFISHHGMKSETPTTAAVDSLLEHEISVLIVSALGLELTADELDPDAPLYGDGIGLDSIDILEIALVVSKQYGIQIKADSAENTTIFASIRGLAAHIRAHRVK
jgi:acyl carrier protein